MFSYFSSSVLKHSERSKELPKLLLPLNFLPFSSSYSSCALFSYIHVNFHCADAGRVRVGPGTPILCVRPRLGILLPGANTSVLWPQVSTSASG